MMMPERGPTFDETFAAHTRAERVLRESDDLVVKALEAIQKSQATTRNVRESRAMSERLNRTFNRRRAQ